MSDDAVEDDRLDRLETECCQRWQHFPADQREALRELLLGALDGAVRAVPETILVTNPTSRPQRLRLHPVASDRELDRMYHQEWCELSVASGGGLYLVYRRRDGEDYATRYDAGVTMPATLCESLPEPLAEALLGGDD